MKKKKIGCVPVVDEGNLVGPGNDHRHS